MITDYYCVEAYTDLLKMHFHSEKIYATNEKTAQEIGAFIKEVYTKELCCPIIVKTNPCQVETVETSSGLKLRDSLEGSRIYLHSKINRVAYQQLLNLNFAFPSGLLHYPPASDKISIEEGSYYSVEVARGQTTRIISYYKDRATAGSVAHFVNKLINEGIKEEQCTTVKDYFGKFVKFPSGKRWIEIANEINEIKSELNLKEYRRLLDIKFT